jgi:hypothetical protein
MEKTRLTLEVSVPVRERLEELRDRIGADSLTEVIRRALALYDTVLTESVEHGRRLVLKDDAGGELEVLLPREIV